MLRAKDIRIFPTIAVTMPIKELHRWSCESPSEIDTMPLRLESEGFGLNASALKRGVVAASNVGGDKYIAAGVAKQMSPTAQRHNSQKELKSLSITAWS